MKYQVELPYTYKSLSRGNKKLYVRYIKGYMKLYYPGLKAKEIIPKGESLADIVICIKK